MTREQRLRGLVAELDISAKMATTVFARMAYIGCMQKLKAILNEESDGWVFDDDKSCAPQSDEWQRGFNRGFELGQKAAPTRPADGSEK